MMFKICGIWNFCRLLFTFAQSYEFFVMHVLKISGSLIVISHMYLKQIYILSFSLKQVVPNWLPIKKLVEVISYSIVLY